VEDIAPLRPTPTGWGPSPYRPLRGLARALAILLVLVTVITAIGGVSDWLAFSRILGNTSTASAEWPRQRMIASLQGVAYLATVTGFLVWFHRAYTNLHALGMEPLRFGAGWAIGGWFVPIFNLVRPKQIMNDIWRGSDPAASASTDGAWHRAPVPALLHLWWALFLMSWLVDRLLVGFALLYEPTAQARRSTFVDNIAIRAIEVLLGIVAVLVVRQVTGARRHVRPYWQATASCGSGGRTVGVERPGRRPGQPKVTVGRGPGSATAGR
jgi:Domain of unknown function (DUF4328)